MKIETCDSQCHGQLENHVNRETDSPQTFVDAASKGALSLRCQEETSSLEPPRTNFTILYRIFLEDYDPPGHCLGIDPFENYSTIGGVEDRHMAYLPMRGTPCSKNRLTFGTLTNEVPLGSCYLAHPPGGQDFQDNVLGSSPLENYSLPRELRLDTWRIYQCGEHHVAGTGSPSTLAMKCSLMGCYPAHLP